jgi:hypothetical protein
VLDVLSMLGVDWSGRRGTECRVAEETEEYPEIPGFRIVGIIGAGSAGWRELVRFEREDDRRDM